VLQEGEGELARKGVVVLAAPAPTLEMAEPQLALHLLVHLLADPAGLDQCRQPLEPRVGREVREVVLAFAAGAVLADEPRLLAGQVLPARRGRPVGHAAHPQRGERGPERPLGAGPPRDGAECLRAGLEQLGGPRARGRGRRVLARPAGRLARRERERHVRGIDLLRRQPPTA
jgi:hypothetical protein